MGFPHGRENDFTKEQPFGFLAKPTKWKKKTQQDRREKNLEEWRGTEGEGGGVETLKEFEEAGNTGEG